MTKYEFFNKLPEEQKGQFAKELYCWLEMYTNEVSAYIFENKLDEIVNNDMSLQLLHELYQRTRIESDKNLSAMLFKLRFPNIAEKEKFELHQNHILTRADSFRDVLYELYIKDMTREISEE